MHGEMAPDNLDRAEPAPYRPKEALYRNKWLDTEGPEDYTVCSLEIGHSQEDKGGVGRTIQARMA